jgi:hypothetical protein
LPWTVIQFRAPGYVGMRPNFTLVHTTHLKPCART